MTTPITMTTIITSSYEADDHIEAMNSLSTNNLITLFLSTLRLVSPSQNGDIFNKYKVCKFSSFFTWCFLNENGRIKAISSWQVGPICNWTCVPVLTTLASNPFGLSDVWPGWQPHPHLIPIVYLKALSAAAAHIMRRSILNFIKCVSWLGEERPCLEISLIWEGAISSHLHLCLVSKSKWMWYN